MARALSHLQAIKIKQAQLSKQWAEQQYPRAVCSPRGGSAEELSCDRQQVLPKGRTARGSQVPKREGR